MRLLFAIFLTAVPVLAMASEGFAGKYNKVVSVGDKAVAWKGLMGVDDRRHSLDEYKDAEVLIVTFTCNHCPVAIVYEQRFIQFVKDYKERSVQFVAINVNNRPDDRLDKMKDRASEEGFNFPYLYDPSQNTARKYGATVTPHLFVLDGERKIGYMGAFDDRINVDDVKKRYVREAVDALLVGRKPKISETRQVGCTIEYERKKK